MSGLLDLLSAAMQPIDGPVTFYASERTLGNLGFPGFEQFSDAARRRKRRIRKRHARYNRGRTGVRPRMRGGR